MACELLPESGQNRSNFRTHHMTTVQAVTSSTSTTMAFCLKEFCLTSVVECAASTSQNTIWKNLHTVWTGRSCRAVSPMAAGNKGGLHLAQAVKHVQNCTFSFSTQSVDVNIECERYKRTSCTSPASGQGPLGKWHITRSVARTHLYSSKKLPIRSPKYSTHTRYMIGASLN